MLKASGDEPGKTTGQGTLRRETIAVRWLGENATETLIPVGKERFVVTDRAMYHSIIGRMDGQCVSPEEEDAFFESFAWVK